MGVRKIVILKKLLFYGVCLTGSENNYKKKDGSKKRKGNTRTIHGEHICTTGIMRYYLNSVLFMVQNN